MGKCISLFLEKDQCPRLKRAIKHDDPKIVLEILSQGFDVDCPLDTLTGNTALILSAFHGAARSITLVLDFCPNLDMCNNDGRTALDKAVICYALARNLCLHKLAEEQRRYFVLRVLVSTGCGRLNPKELELCVRLNENDREFLNKLVNVISSSPIPSLKNTALKVFINVDTHYTFVKKLLVAGAAFDDFRNSWKSMTWRLKRPLSTELILTIIRATSDTSILKTIKDYYQSTMRSPRTPMPVSVSVLMFLTGCTSEQPLKKRIRDPFYKCLLAEVVREGPPTLQHFCRTSIRNQCYPNVYFAVRKIGLPSAFRNYITLDAVL